MTKQNRYFVCSHILEKKLENLSPSFFSADLTADLEDLSFAERPEACDPWNQEKVEQLIQRCKTTCEKILRYS